MAGLALVASVAALTVALVRSPAESPAPEPASQSETLAVAATAEPEAASAGAAAGAVYEAAAAGVVEITRSGVSEGEGQFPFGPDGGQSEAQGTGFVIDDEGHIVTNEHVVSGADSVSVTFADGTEAAAEVIGTDPSSDIALLEVDGSASELRPIELGSSGDLVVGENVYALGNPYGLEGTLTAGIVSALDRTIQAPNGYTIDGAIQTDAAINSGNSGGPLLDAEGRVVGVTAQIESTNGGNVGIGYAIPIDLVKEVVSQLASGEAIAHAYLGVAVEDADSRGAAIAEVRAGSPAEQAGLEVGDVVVSADGQTIESPDSLTSIIAAKQPGDSLELTIARDGAEQTISVTLGERR